MPIRCAFTPSTSPSSRREPAASSIITRQPTTVHVPRLIAPERTPRRRGLHLPRRPALSRNRGQSRVHTYAPRGRAASAACGPWTSCRRRSLRGRRLRGRSPRSCSGRGSGGYVVEVAGDGTLRGVGGAAAPLGLGGEHIIGGTESYVLSAWKRPRRGATGQRCPCGSRQWRYRCGPVPSPRLQTGRRTGPTSVTTHERVRPLAYVGGGHGGGFGRSGGRAPDGSRSVRGGSRGPGRSARSAPDISACTRRRFARPLGRRSSPSAAHTLCPL